MGAFKSYKWWMRCQDGINGYQNKITLCLIDQEAVVVDIFGRDAPAFVFRKKQVDYVPSRSTTQFPYPRKCPAPEKIQNQNSHACSKHLRYPWNKWT